MTPLKTTQYCRYLLSALILLCLTACNTTQTKVESDFDRETNFKSYQTFAFLSPLGTDEAEYTTLTSGYFKTAAKNEMEALGYTYMETTPDLLVNFFANTENRSDVKNGRTLSGSFGYPSYMYYGFPYYMPETKTKHYKMGALKIDVIDAKAKKLIWQGSTEKKLQRHNAKNPEQTITSAVQLIFQQYPLTNHTAESANP